MYYMLECYGPMEFERQAIASEPTEEMVSWMRGLTIETPLPTPIEVEMDGDGIMMPMFKRGILLFRDDLIQAMESAGVDNMDYYDTVLIDPVANVRYDNYKAVNIIGLVAAADLQKSKYTAPSGVPMIDTNFDSVVIDEEKAMGLLMFRMAECVSAIVIHEKVKDYIEQAGIKYLDFIKPKKWFG
jgi:hypothetical protein